MPSNIFSINRINAYLVLSLLFACSFVFPMKFPIKEEPFSLAYYVPTSLKQILARVFFLDDKLGRAVHKDDIASVETLIAWGADPTKDVTLLQNAQNSEMYKLLLSHGARDSKFGFALRNIHEWNDTELLKMYCACHDMRGYISALRIALEKKWPEGARVMLLHGLDITTCHPTYGNIFHESWKKSEVEFFVTAPQLQQHTTLRNNHIKRMAMLRLCLRRIGASKDIRNLLCSYVDYAIPDDVFQQHIAHVCIALQQRRIDYEEDNIPNTPFQFATDGEGFEPEAKEILGMDATELKKEYEPIIKKEYVQMLRSQFTKRRAKSPS